MKHDLSSLVQKEVVVEEPEKESMGDLTIEVVKKVLPNNFANYITQEFVDTLNNVSSSQEEAEIIRENFITYTSVLNDGRYKTEDYLNAIKYVSFKLMNMSNKEAYVKTFPARYSRLIAIGTSEKDVSSYVSSYSKNKLVNKILEQSLVPTWVLNQDMHQKALNTLCELMNHAKSEKVRCDSAIGLLSSLQKPKEVGPLLNIDMRENSGLQDLKSTLSSLAQQQLSLMNHGITAKTIAEQKLVVGSNE